MSRFTTASRAERIAHYAREYEAHELASMLIAAQDKTTEMQQLCESFASGPTRCLQASYDFDDPNGIYRCQIMVEEGAVEHDGPCWYEGHPHPYLQRAEAAEAQLRQLDPDYARAERERRIANCPHPVAGVDCQVCNRESAGR